MKRFIVLTGLVLASALTSPVFAVDNASTGGTTRDAIRGTIKPSREDAAENRVNVRATVTQNRTDFRERVKAVRDERKLQILERMEGRFNNINERRTNHFQKVLDRLRRILERIQSRSDRAKSNGKDVSAVETAIAQATAAIDAAEQAVNDQKAKTYNVTVTDETTARNEVGDTLKTLQEDLHATWQKVQDARKAVFDALRKLAAIVGGPKLTPTAVPTATESATQ